MGRDCRKNVRVVACTVYRQGFQFFRRLLRLTRCHNHGHDTGNCGVDSFWRGLQCQAEISRVLIKCTNESFSWRLINISFYSFLLILT